MVTDVESTQTEIYQQSNNVESNSNKIVNRAANRGFCWFGKPGQLFKNYVSLTLSGFIIRILYLSHYISDFMFSPMYFFSIRGSENLHVYIWLMKDMAWAQSWHDAGYFFGCVAVIWCAVIVFHAIRERNTNEIFVNVGQLMWLFANTWWMTGDLHDFKYPDGPRWYVSYLYIVKA